MPTFSLCDAIWLPWPPPDDSHFIRSCTRLHCNALGPTASNVPRYASRQFKAAMRCPKLPRRRFWQGRWEYWTCITALAHLLKIAEDLRVAVGLVLQPCVAVIPRTTPLDLALRHLLGCNRWPQALCIHYACSNSAPVAISFSRYIFPSRSACAEQTRLCITLFSVK